MAMSLGTSLNFWRNRWRLWKCRGFRWEGKSLRGLLTGKGPTGSGQGILGNWGKKVDARIFGRKELE